MEILLLGPIVQGWFRGSRMPQAIGRFLEVDLILGTKNPLYCSAAFNMERRPMHWWSGGTAVTRRRLCRTEPRCPVVNAAGYTSVAQAPTRPVSPTTCSCRCRRTVLRLLPTHRPYWSTRRLPLHRHPPHRHLREYPLRRLLLLLAIRRHLQILNGSLQIIILRLESLLMARLLPPRPRP